MKFRNRMATLAVVGSLSFVSVAAQAQQVDFGQLRGSVSACSGVAGPAAGQAATCAQWISLTSCIADAARAAGGVTDAGATTCGGLAGQAVMAADEAGRVCAQATATTRTERDQAARNNAELTRVRNELAGVRRELAQCEDRLRPRRSPAVFPSGNRPIRLPVCLAGDQNGNAELWCRMRDGRQLIGDDCRGAPRADIVRAGCQCPEGGVPVQPGRHAVGADGQRIVGYMCAAVFTGSNGTREVVPPPAYNDPEGAARRIADIDATINDILARLGTVEEVAGVHLCNLPPGVRPTVQNCRPRAATAAPATPAPSSASHVVWFGFSPTYRITYNHLSPLGMAGYGVSLRLGEKWRLPLGIGAIVGDYGAPGTSTIFGLSAYLGINYQVTSAVEIGLRGRFTELMDFAVQDHNVEPIGAHRGYVAAGGLAASFGLGAGFAIDAEALFGVADTIWRSPVTNNFESVSGLVFQPFLGLSWRTR